jgi:hypothetical protein
MCCNLSFTFHTEHIGLIWLCSVRGAWHPRISRSLRKVMAEKREREEREITLLIVATKLATQPMCNAARAVHALRSIGGADYRGYYGQHAYGDG